MNTNSEIDDMSSSSHSTQPPYLPPSMLGKRVNWDVFLSFRGGDTRHSFTAPLRDALESKGLRPFMDDRGMEKGDTIGPTLEEAIVDSALAVAIVSPRYADSRWCLQELHMIFECGKRVIPVFYDVDPSHVRRQKGPFGDGFKELVTDESKKLEKDDIDKWREALQKVGNISGYPCQPQSEESQVIPLIVQQVWRELKNTPEYVVRVAVGLDSRVKKAVAKLDLGSNEVRFLGVHGTPGIGKTTLAKAVFNKLVVRFSNRCFISNVREQLSNEGGILSVQNELIRELSLGKVQAVEQEGVAKSKLKRIVEENRVLVVLDDVFEAEQLEKIGIIRGWFDQGSRIIVTSRNVDALISFASNSDELYEAEKLDDEESLELFSVHALGRQEPTPEFKDVSKEIVSLTGGLPLALEVFGSLLVKKTVKEWKDAVMKLRLNRPPNLQDVLKFSYDYGLDEQEKTVFLDISCLLLQLDMKKEDVIDVLAGCDLRAELAIGKLVERSLLKIRERDELWMHDQIRDMGRQIVIEKSSHDVRKQSRLWNFVEIMSVLRKEKVTEAVRGIVLDIKKPPDFTDEQTYWSNFRRHPNIRNFIKYVAVRFNGLTSRHKQDEDDNSIIHTKWFEKSVHLKLLQMDYAKLKGNFDYMPSELRWLRWKGCSLKTLSAIPDELRVLDLSRSKIQQLWSSDCPCGGFNKVVGKLVVINLSNCPKLTALPDMSGHRHLKKLILEHCVGLSKLHESIGSMSSLVHLNLLGCSNLVEFPRDVTGMKGLKELILSDCFNFRQLPQDVRSMTSLIQLLLDRTAITELPKTVFHLTKLEVLSLRRCRQLTCLPDSIGSLTSLKELSLLDTKLETLPCSVGSLTNLETLNLMHCTSLTSLPESVGNLKTLSQLLLTNSSIEQLPESISSLSYLRVLSLASCSSLVELPNSLERLASIVELELDRTPIKVLPDEIRSLKFVEKLRMNNCTSLEKLPEKIGEMSNLSYLFVEGAAITELPESLGDLENLTWLRLARCSRLRSLPDSMERLTSLRTLMIQETAVTSLPEKFGLLNLSTLMMRKSSNDLPKLSVLPTSFCKLSNLEEFNAYGCGISGKIEDDFNKLSGLQVLNLGFNNFHTLPSSLKGLCVLKKLILRHCEDLRVLPPLPSALEELNASDCHSLESVTDLSNLERLQELQLANCSKIVDVPGLQCLKSLRRLFMGGCNASASAIRGRLTKAVLRNLNNLCVPGSEIPSWFCRKEVNFTPHPNLAIKYVIVAVVLSVDIQALDDIRAQVPSIVDLQARIIRQDEPIFKTAINLAGLPLTKEDQLYLSRYKDYHPLVSFLKKDDIIQVGWKSGAVDGIELRSWGIHLVYENDDNYDGDEDSFPLPESEQSVSQRLVRFFRSVDQNR